MPKKTPSMRRARPSKRKRKTVRGGGRGTSTRSTKGYGRR